MSRPRLAGALLVRLALGGWGLPSERDGHARLVRAAVDHDLDLVAGLVRGDRVAELFGGGNLVAVESDDDVATEDVGLAGDDDPPVPGLETGLVRAGVVRDRLDDDALLDCEVVRAGQVRGDGLTAGAEERVVDAPGPDDLGDDVLDGVRRDRETDPDVPRRRVAGLDLRVHPDDLAATVEERTARIAVVDGRVR